MKANRKELLKELQTVEIGLSPEETVSQSDCFVFKDGEVMTYNNKVACHYKCSLNITGAVNASKLLKMVARSNDEEIEFNVGKGRLDYKGKAKKGYIRMDKDILLPIADVKTPKKWVSLSKEVIEAIHQVSNCAALSQKVPHLACVNITPNLVEACDGYQAGRVEIKTPFKKSTLVRASTLRNILKLDVSHVGLMNNWIHFKNKAGLIISTLTEIEKYPTDKLTKIFDIKGSPAKLSTGLKELVSQTEQTGVPILIEPLNRYETHFLNRVEQAVEICREVGTPDNIRILADFFHMSIEEMDIASALKNGGKYIGYIHLADSNRMEPGAGHTDFASGIAALKSIGYDGWLTIESGASTESEDALRRANDFIRLLWDAS